MSFGDVKCFIIKDLFSSLHEVNYGSLIEFNNTNIKQNKTKQKMPQGWMQR